MKMTTAVNIRPVVVQSIGSLNPTTTEAAATNNSSDHEMIIPISLSCVFLLLILAHSHAQQSH